MAVGKRHWLTLVNTEDTKSITVFYLCLLKDIMFCCGSSRSCTSWCTVECFGVFRALCFAGSTLHSYPLDGYCSVQSQIDWKLVKTALTSNAAKWERVIWWVLWAGWHSCKTLMGNSLLSTTLSDWDQAGRQEFNHCTCNRRGNFPQVWLILGISPRILAWWPSLLCLPFCLLFGLGERTSVPWNFSGTSLFSESLKRSEVIARLRDRIICVIWAPFETKHLEVFLKQDPLPCLCFREILVGKCWNQALILGDLGFFFLFPNLASQFDS